MYKMFKVIAETFAKNRFHTMNLNKTDNKSVLWIKMIDTQKKLDVKNTHDLVDKEIKGKFKTNNPADEQIKKHKKHGSELIDGEKFRYAHEGIIIPVIMHCRTPELFKFKRSLGFKLHDVITCKEQTVLGSVKYAFEGKNMQTQFSVLGYKIDLYFHEYKLVTEVDELSHNYRTIDYEIQRQKALEKELGCVFIRINPDEENRNILKAINEIHRHIKKWSKKSLIDKISKRLLGLEFKSNHSIIKKALKRVVKR